MTALLKTRLDERKTSARISLGTAAVLMSAILMTPDPVRAQAVQPTCADRTTVMSQLAARYQEQPVNMGLTNSGAMLEVLASDSGTWTIVMTTPQGMTCMVAAGQHWEPVEKKKAGFVPSADERVH